MKTYQTSTKIGRPYGQIYEVNKGTEYEYKKGLYHCNNGIVSIYSEPTFASFSFIVNGKMHFLSISDLKTPFTDRQLLIRAGKFAKKILKDLNIG